jgi:hypothetical protein
MHHPAAGALEQIINHWTAPVSAQQKGLLCIVPWALRACTTVIVVLQAQHIVWGLQASTPAAALQRLQRLDSPGEAVLRVTLGFL